MSTPLVLTEKNREKIVASGALASLIEILSCPMPELQRQAAKSLANLAVNRELSRAPLPCVFVTDSEWCVVSSRHQGTDRRGWGISAPHAAHHVIQRVCTV